MDSDNESQLDDKQSNLHKLYDIKFIRNKHCITILIGDKYKIQLILRLYKTISEILHGFDLGCSAIGFDGKQLYFTSLSKFSYEYMCNIVDTTRRSTTYEKRLMKYFDRGFDIILPHLDITKLRKRYIKYDLPEVCELPYFIFSYKNITGNKIYFENYLGKQKDGKKFIKDSDYQIEDLDMYNIFYVNLGNLVSNKDDFYYFSEHHNLDILNDGPFISRKKVINFYDNLKQKIYKKNTLNIGLINKYISIAPVNDIIVELFTANIDKNEYLSDIIEKQKQLMLSALERIATINHSQLPWMETEPFTQLTSSFNPIIEDPQQWYKSYYRHIV